MKTEEIVRSLRWCGTGTEEGCNDCAFEPQCDEDAVGRQEVMVYRDGS